MKHLIALFFLSSLISCQKKVVNDDSEQDQDVTISVNLTSPFENSTFQISEVVSITGTISSNETIHGYTVELFNASNNDSLLFSSNVHSHDATLNFTYSWTHNLSVTSDVVVRVTALGDHQGLKSEVLNRSIQCLGI